MQTKTNRIAEEFQTLDVKNKRLKQLIMLTDQFSKLEFGKEIVVTEIYRTVEEQKELYKHTPPDRRPKVSPHQLWHSVDLRSWIYTDREIERLLEFLNCFRYLEGQRKVAVYHKIRMGAAHFHVQYS